MEDQQYLSTITTGSPHSIDSTNIDTITLRNFSPGDRSDPGTFRSASCVARGGKAPPFGLSDMPDKNWVGMHEEVSLPRAYAARQEDRSGAAVRHKPWQEPGRAPPHGQSTHLQQTPSFPRHTAARGTSSATASWSGP